MAGIGVTLQGVNINLYAFGFLRTAEADYYQIELINKVKVR